MAAPTVHLQRPPIIEVVCGVVFDSVDELDALALGIYWDERSKDFPGRSLQLALGEPVSGGPLPFPMRALFISQDDQFVLQLQRDRFFMNWRKRGQTYPRFSSGGDGLLQRARAEFERFEAFVKRRFDKALAVKRIDMAKINLLSRGAEWSDLHELAKMLPLAGVFDTVQDARSREFNLTFVEHGDVGDMTLNMATAVGPDGPTGVRIESRIVCQTDAGRLWDTFEAANVVLNRVFFSLFSPSGVSKLEGMK